MSRKWTVLGLLALAASTLSFGQGDFSKKPPPDGPPPLPAPAPPPSDLDVYCPDWAMLCGADAATACPVDSGPIGTNRLKAVLNHGIPPEDNTVGTDVVVTNSNVGVWIQYVAYGVSPDDNILMANYCVFGPALGCGSSQCKPDTDGNGELDCFLACFPDSDNECKSATCPGGTGRSLQGCTRKTDCGTCTCELSREPQTVAPGETSRLRCSMPDCGSELEPCDNPDPMNPVFCSAPSPPGAAHVLVTAVNFDGGGCFLPLDPPIQPLLRQLIPQACTGSPLVNKADESAETPTE